MSAAEQREPSVAVMGTPRGPVETLGRAAGVYGRVGYVAEALI